MMPDPLTLRALGSQTEQWKWNFHLPTSSTRYVLSYYAALTGRWAGWHHIQFMGFYSVTGDYVIMGVSDAIGQKHGS